MKWEVKSYNTGGFGTQLRYNAAASMPPREITNEEAKVWADFLVKRGAARFEREDCVFYDLKLNNYVTETHIFWK